MRTDEEDLAVGDDDVRFLDLDAARADCFCFPSLEHDSGFEPLLDEIVVEGFLVFNDTHGRLPWRRILAHRGSRLDGEEVVVEKSVLVGHSALQMFTLVDTVEAYPQFLPWCNNAQVIHRDEHRTRATIHINYHGVKHSFTTENTKHP